MLRQPAVAGHFYPGKRQPLHDLIERLLPTDKAPSAARGIISPHAGYVYSGAIAAATFAAVNVPEQVIVMGPNHHGFGHSAALYASGSWLTPLGEVMIDAGLAALLLAACPALACDESAHLREHSLEVQIPLIQMLNPVAQIVPICFGHLPLDVLVQTGEQIGALLNEQARDVLLVASSDMTHFESASRAREHDFLALERILALDPEGLYTIVHEQRISMCGVIPTVVMLAAVRVMGGQQAELIRYGNSGEVSGDDTDVVGYAGVVIH